MAKESSVDKEERRKEKKASKAKHSETNGIHRSRKDKKEKKGKSTAVPAEAIETTTRVIDASEAKPEGGVSIKEDDDAEVKVKNALLLGALVPFANPLADEKTEKKVLKSVKKAAKNKALKRGVKEVVKALRKSSTSSSSALPSAIVVIAADISPMDVISHLPVLCEDHSIPYIFVRSRTELGAAGSTKRPTSVTMICKDKGEKKKEVADGDGDGEWSDVYKDLVRYVAKASRDVRI